MPDFVHLHNHSDFSLLRASSTVGGLVGRAESLGMPAVALTDDGNLFGAVEFFSACKHAKSKVKPIIGCDFFLAPESRHTKAGGENANRYSRLVLLAQTQQGYLNLMMLSSLGYTEGFYYRPRIDHQLVERYAAGLVALSGSVGGEIPQLIARNRVEEAKSLCAWYKELFGAGRWFLELTDHGIPEQKFINETLLDFSRRMDVPVVATNDTYYLTQADADAHDVLLCIGSGRKRHETNRFRFSTGEFWVKSAEEMARLFGTIDGALSNSLAIAESCNVELKKSQPELPEYEIPPEFTDEGDYLRHLTYRGLAERYGDQADNFRRRADYELSIIIPMRFSGYFLIVWDFIKFARDNGIPVGPGRGSGAGSIVAYALRITDVEPNRYGLLFERFLNPDRISMPDFDIDFCFERRQEVIDYVTQKYKTDHVGQIITFGTLKAKAVMRDVARVLDIPYTEATKTAKLVPAGPKVKLQEALASVSELEELRQQGGRTKELIDISLKLEGLHRHASTHAAGVVISRDVLTAYVPLYRDPKTEAISTQFTWDLIEDRGLVKMDFLGLKTLTLITNTVRLIRRRGDNFDEDDIPEGDKKTYTMLSEGRSACVFQFESPGMRAQLRRVRPTRIEDLIALNALFRPGPMENIPQFVDSKWGRTPIRYPHPSLEKVLEETYGVIVYQEQVMEIVQIIAKFSLGEADILRKAMGKKLTDVMAKMKVGYLAGAKANGVDEATAEAIFKLLEPFAGYGFNKSHAAAYSVLAYKTAYLKANYPAEFMAANLTNEINDPDKFSSYLAETRAMGLQVLPPNINVSETFFTVADGKIVFGIVGIKNIGSAAVREILRARENGGPFTSMLDFLERIDLKTVNKKVVETGIMTGLFDCLSPQRSTLLFNLDRLYEFAAAKKAGKAYGQVSLFEACSDEEFRPPELVVQPDWDLATRLQYERELLGHYFSGHPLDEVAEVWRRRTNLDLSNIEAAAAERSYTAIVLITNVRVTTTKRGGRMAVLRVEDFRGSMAAVLWPEVYDQYADLVVAESIVGLIGTVDHSREETQLVVSEVREPEQCEERDMGEVHIRLSDTSCSEEDLYQLRAFLYDKKGACPVFLHIPTADDETVVRASAQLCVSSRLETIEDIDGHSLVAAVWRV